MPTILVTGATGTTGVEVVRALGASGKFDVVAGVRDVNKASDLNNIKGVRLVKLDSDKPDTVSAFKGVQGVYVLTALQQPGFKQWLDAIKAAGVGHVVYHSAIGTSPDAPLAAARDHFKHEELLKASGVPYTILRPAFFHQNIEKFHLATITQHSMFAGSAGSGRFASVDLRDVATAAVEAFSHPERHSGKLYTLMDEITTEPIIASYISATVGRPVQYVSWTPEEHRAQLTKLGFPAWLIDELIVLDMIKREQWTADMSNDLEHIIGRKGITVEQYIKDIADKLNAGTAKH